LECLAALGCVEAQGYLFGKPRPRGDVAEIAVKLASREVVEAAS
jgi:EAL domain-containing protein (putative c-di-GMP-specific phosphodiesterase class I)